MKLSEIKQLHEGLSKLKRDYEYITKMLKDNEIADDDGFEIEENPNAIFGNLTSRNSIQYYINCVDLSGDGKYMLEIQQRGKKKLLMQDDDLSIQHLVAATDKFLRNN